MPAGIYVPTCEGGASVDNQGSLWLWGSTFVNYDIPDAGILEFIDNSGVGWATADVFSLGICELGGGGTWHDMGYNVLVEPDFSTTGGSDQDPCIDDWPATDVTAGPVVHDADVPAPLNQAPKTFLGLPANNGGPTDCVTAAG